MAIRIALVVLAALAFTSGCPPSVDVILVAATEGDLQCGAQGETLASSIAVVLVDQERQPVSGIDVMFVPCEECGSVAHEGLGTDEPDRSFGVTDQLGRASVAWTLGSRIGAQSVTATIEGVEPIVFVASASQAIGEPPNVMVIESGDNQAVLQHTLISVPLTARVLDRFGNGVPAVPVFFVSTLESGYVEPTATSTDASGMASWTGFVHAPGVQNIVARVDGLPEIQFTLNVTNAGQPFDGEYSCNLFGTADPQHIHALMIISADTISGAELDNGVPIQNHGISGTLNQSTGTYTASYRASLDYHWELDGTITIDNRSRAFASGTFDQFDRSVLIGTGSLTCERQ